MSRIDLKQVEKRYGDVEVLRNINLNIEEGEFVVLVGPSGCGKSTLLRSIAGLEDVTDGNIEIGGKIMNDIAPKDRDISMVFQSYALYPHLSVARNMGFSLEVRKLPKDQIEKAVNEAADILNLTHLLDRKPKELSGGQRQRVAMGRAIVRDSKVFLFDEPLSNLDAQLRGKMRVEIKNLHKRLGNTIVYVTHDQVEAMTLADKIVVLNHGLIQQVGTPLELYDNPVNKFVASFIGSPSMNFLDGELVYHDQHVCFCINETSLIPIPQSDITINQYGNVEIGIRPENMVICEKDEPYSIPVKVSLIEPTGISELIHGEIGDQYVTIFSTERCGADVGDTIYINCQQDKALLFDKSSKKRVII
ncbi:sn-glycerol-3-phosphate ABC transporter ATP-binding protein UgpC [Vibrio sp.]|nr:sn-glycerol-3-phosphate ABC transporter ATP-binding protein UgpC [Vibrio sp.]